MKFDADTMRRLSPLIDEALDLDDLQRQVWLSGLTGESAALVPLLKELWSQDVHQRMDAVLERGPALPVDEACAQETMSAHQPGDTVNQFRLLEILATGGMGEVWLAERADGNLKRHVAIKLPVFNAHNSVFLQRLQSERDILAALTHPHIAHLYDAGVTADQQPYLVLEYVPGLEILACAKAHTLDTTQRVKLLRQVTDAVQYAHSKHVIHRDIKPSNVMVTPEGRAMLLDFGIAKVLESDHETSSESDITRIGGRALTPQCAAPEQILNQPVGVTTDVWALGILLYRLVTDAAPFEDPDRSALEHSILTQEPQTPSHKQSGSISMLGKRSAADLDYIILRALKKNPDQRYATVDALNQDLDQWLAGHTVSKPTQSVAQRLKNWTSLHKPAYAVAAALLASALTYALAVVWINDSGLLRPLKAMSAKALGHEPLSIIVLPFVNATGDARQAYVAEGMTASLTSDVARIRDIFVVSLNSAMAYKDKPVQAQQIVNELGVRFILSGNVQGADSRLRVTVQLTDAATNAQLWSERFEGELSNVLQFQDSITARIANTIAPEMIVAAVRTQTPRMGDSRVADLTLHARALDLKRDTLENLQNVEALYRKILLLEPENWSAMARVSRSISLQAVNFSHELSREAVERKTQEAYELATKVREMDPENTDVYSPIANYWRFHGNFDASLQAGQTWVAVEPNNPRAYVLLAYDSYFNVQPQKVIDLLNQSIHLHPKILSVSESNHRSMGRAYFMLGDDDQAIYWLQKTLEINPKSAFAYQWLALAWARKGDLEKSHAAAAEAHRLGPDRKLSTEKGYPSTPAAFDKWFEKEVVPAWHQSGMPL